MKTQEMEAKKQVGETDAAEVPLWRQISGITVENEAALDADARDAAIRALINDVEKRAIVEFERGEAGKIPERERTVFWDPLARICLQLGISRTKLSSYARELTGMRAHEISDRILAKRVLFKRLRARVERLVVPELEAMRKTAPPRERIYEGHRRDTEARFIRWARATRSKDRRARFAAEMGFANPSRLNRACLLAHGMSIDEMEANLVAHLVQKFFGELMKGTGEPPRRQERQEQQEKEKALTPETQAILDDAVAFALGKKKEAVA